MQAKADSGKADNNFGSVPLGCAALGGHCEALISGWCHAGAVGVLLVAAGGGQAGTVGVLLDQPAAAALVAARTTLEELSRVFGRAGRHPAGQHGPRRVMKRDEVVQMLLSYGGEGRNNNGGRSDGGGGGNQRGSGGGGGGDDDDSNEDYTMTTTKTPTEQTAV